MISLLMAAAFAAQAGSDQWCHQTHHHCFKGYAIPTSQYYRDSDPIRNYDNPTSYWKPVDPSPIIEAKSGGPYVEHEPWWLEYLWLEASIVQGIIILITFAILKSIGGTEDTADWYYED